MQNVSVSRIVKEDRDKDNTNKSFLSCISDEKEEFNTQTEHMKTDFNDSFSSETKDKTKEERQGTRQEETKEERHNIQETAQAILVIQDAVKDEVQKVISSFNQEITQSDDRLDDIIKQVKKNCNKPLNMSKTNKRPLYNTDGLTESEKRLRRDLIIKIRNYIDCFVDHETIGEICGNDLTSSKHSLYERDMQELNNIYESIQVGINSSKDYEQFMHMFSTGLKSLEFDYAFFKKKIKKI